MRALHIASLWDALLWIALAVWVLAVVRLVTAAVRARASRDVIAAGALIAAMLLALIAASATSGAELAELEDTPGALHVKITGRQWWWQIDYEPDDPARTATTANELHVPVGRPVHLQLVSGDVIHSFWVPSLHGTRDLIPGRVDRTWIRIDEPGTYRGPCAVRCGLEHAHMAITVIAEPPDQFEAWLARQREPAAPPAGEQQRRGQRVFLGGPCALCHAISGTPAGGRLGPDLSHFASRTTIASAVPNTVGHLAGWIADPQAIKPGVRMPAIAVPPDDLLALVAYLKELR